MVFVVDNLSRMLPCDLNYATAENEATIRLLDPNVWGEPVCLPSTNYDYLFWSLVAIGCDQDEPSSISANRIPKLQSDVSAYLSIDC